MKVIDLLNKITKGEIPKKIKYRNATYIYDEKQEDYGFFFIDHYEYLLDDIRIISQLNNEVEIIEDKPKHIEELKEFDFGTFKGMTPYEVFEATMEEYKKFNELRKAVNYLLDKEGK